VPAARACLGGEPQPSVGAGGAGMNRRPAAVARVQGDGTACRSRESGKKRESAQWCSGHIALGTELRPQRLRSIRMTVHFRIGSVKQSCPPASRDTYGRMRATIKDKVEVARGTLFVTFDLQGETVDFKPGQYFWVTLLDPPYDDEKGPRRHITVVTSPTERGVLGLATRLRDSAFKRSLDELPVGTAVDVEQPKGEFVLPEDSDRPYVFIAGGIGITVFRSMLRYVADEQLPYRVTLLYSNRDRESTAFMDELQELERAIPGLRVVYTMTGDPSWEGETRRIDADFLRDQIGDELLGSTYLVAGPPPMVEGIVEALQSAGVLEDQIRPDRFSGY
jgi:ferredoxin-NADP reductase